MADFKESIHLLAGFVSPPMMNTYLPVAAVMPEPSAVEKFTDTALDVSPNLTMVSVTSPVSSFTVYCVGSKPTITTVEVQGKQWSLSW